MHVSEFVPVHRLFHAASAIPTFVGNEPSVIFSRIGPIELPLPGRRLGSLKLVTDGEEQYKINGDYYHLRPGKALWVPAKQSFETHIRKNRITEGICLYGYFDDLAPAESMFINIPKQFESALATMAKKLQAGHTEVDNAFSQIMVAWQEFTKAQTTAEAALAMKREATGKELSIRLARVRDWMIAESHLQLDNTELAQEACLSSFAFARRFREAFGISPHDFLVEQRIRRASQLIRQNPALALTQVAEQVGYADLPTFSKVFRRKTGQSPSLWRQQVGTKRQ